MSASSTNVERQAKQHRPALIGIGASVVIAAVLFLAYAMVVTDPTPSEGDLLNTQTLATD